MKEASGGKFTHCTHWDAKALVADYARKQLPAVTVLIPGSPSSDASWRSEN
jgi:hypothetical protein